LPRRHRNGSRGPHQPRIGIGPAGHGARVERHRQGGDARMTADATLAVTVGALFAVGVSVMVSRNLIKVTLGFLTMAHGADLRLHAAGTCGRAPILGEEGPSATDADPLPQAFVLTSIVITLAVTCFLLTLFYRGYLHTRALDVPTSPDDAPPQVPPRGG